MKKEQIKDFGFIFALLATWVAGGFAVSHYLGSNGLFGDVFTGYTWLKMTVYFVIMSHLTISAMSIAFHRSHTHQAVKLHPLVDYPMQTWLWMITSMSKLDWVSVHIYHHAHSDTEKDPHSPTQKGLAKVFFLGVLDYSRAKGWPEVLKIRNRLPTSAYERFIARHTFLAPIILTSLLIIAFGPLYGSLMGVLNFAISPLFAVGGVNAIAHSIGYKNYDSKDDSRNIGFLFFLNWIISGELDHNNHHRFPKSPSFAHRWFEFDIGWVYIRMMRSFGLAKVTGHIPEYAKHALSASAPSLSNQMAARVAAAVQEAVQETSSPTA
jgi:stearoyl-CoA desaturase (delta-9 desaturase)